MLLIRAGNRQPDCHLDALGQRTALDDSRGHAAFGYDKAGRLTSASYPDGSTEADQYEPAGNRTLITSTTALGATSVHTGTYDAADELSSLAGPAGVTRYSYDRAGQQAGNVGPGGAVVNTYNDLHQLTHVSGPVSSLSLVYDGQGDRLRSNEQNLVGGLSGLVSDGL